MSEPFRLVRGVFPLHSRFDVVFSGIDPSFLGEDAVVRAYVELFDDYLIRAEIYDDKGFKCTKSTHVKDKAYKSFTNGELTLCELFEKVWVDLKPACLKLCAYSGDLGNLCQY